MRRQDKKKNMERVNILFEQRVNESMNNLDWGKSTDERNVNVDKYNSLKTDKEKTEFAKSLKESPTFGGEKVSQDQYDELQYDKSTMGKSMSDAFKTPDDYEMKNYIEIGGTYNTPDGDMVKVVGQTPEGHIKVVLTHGQDTVDQYKKWGLPSPPPLKIAWSKVQFDTIMGQMDDHDESQYQGERHGY